MQQGEQPTGCPTNKQPKLGGDRDYRHRHLFRLSSSAFKETAGDVVLGRRLQIVPKSRLQISVFIQIRNFIKRINCPTFTHPEADIVLSTRIKIRAKSLNQIAVRGNIIIGFKGHLSAFGIAMLDVVLQTSLRVIAKAAG